MVSVEFNFLLFDAPKGASEIEGVVTHLIVWSSDILAAEMNALTVSVRPSL